MPEVLILRGLPGSGKSTWAESWIATRASYIRVNRDSLRQMTTFGKFVQNVESMVGSLRDLSIVQSVLRGYSVVVDDTNLMPYHSIGIRSLVEPIGIPVRLVNFSTPLHECIARDAERPMGRRVGEIRIREMDEQKTQWDSTLRGYLGVFEEGAATIKVDPISLELR